MPLPSFTRHVLLRVVLPLVFLCYFGSLAAAAFYFPVPYDWRYRVISNLLSPRDNPDFYRVPSLGIALAGVLMLPLAGHLAARLNGRGAARFARWSLRAGIVLLICSAVVVPQHVRPVLGMRHLHEIFARTAAVGFGLGMLALCLEAWRDRRGTQRLDRRLLPIWAGLTLLPIAGILASEALLLAARWMPQWGPGIKEAMRQSVFWHLGFWEWAGSGAVFAFLAAGVWLLPALDMGAEHPGREG